MGTLYTMGIATIIVLYVLFTHLLLTLISKRFKLHAFFKKDGVIMTLSYIIGIVLFLITLQVYLFANTLLVS